MLAFDNMQDRGVTGTTDWKRYDIELPVAADAKNINFGAILSGNGTAWFDGLSVQLDGAPYLDKTVFDLDFESPTPTGFYTGGNGYLVELDSQVFHNGKQSLRMKRSGPANEARALIQRSHHRRGKRSCSIWKPLARRTRKRALRPAISSGAFKTRESSCRACKCGRTKSRAIKAWPTTSSGFWTTIPARRSCSGHTMATSRPGARRGFNPMGAALRKMFGNQMVVFGFAFNQGSFQAMEMPFSPKSVLRTFNVVPAPEGSLDAMLASAGLQIAAIDLRALPKEGEVANWFSEPRATKSIGAGYGEQFAANFLAKQVTPKIYDVLLFVEKTTAARPLGKRTSAGP